MCAHFKGWASGKGTWIDWCIRFATRSKYSHVEIILGYPEFPNGQTVFECFSSSARDGGVRLKNIHLREDRWDLVTTHWPGDETKHDGFFSYLGLKYDYIGIFLSQTLNLARHDKRRWFCSEICAGYLGLSQPQTYSPSRLYEAIKMMNGTFFLGIRQGHDEELEFNRKSLDNRLANWNPKKPKG